jgi:hypothetical protein
MTEAQMDKDWRMCKAKWRADDYLKHCALHPYRTFFRRLFGYVG